MNSAWRPRTSVALERLVENIGSVRWPITTWASGCPANGEDAISSIILGTSLLTAHGVPVAGEMEIKNVQAMKILDTFGVGGRSPNTTRWTTTTTWC